MKKFLTMLLLVFFISIIYAYTLVIEKIPTELVIFEGENISMRTLFGVSIKSDDKETIETSSNNGNKIGGQVRKINIRSKSF